MLQIHATTSACRLTPVVGHPGAEATLKIENLSNQPLPSDEISVSIDSPKHVAVRLEHAVQYGDEWKPFYDIEPNDSILIPLFVRSEVYRQKKGGSLSVTVEVEDETYEMEIELTN